MQTRLVREGGDGTTWSVLRDWALPMEVMLEDRHLWQAIEIGTAICNDDQLALEAILRGVPPEMMATLAAKGTTKEAWDELETIRLGVTHV